MRIGEREFQRTLGSRGAACELRNLELEASRQFEARPMRASLPGIGAPSDSIRPGTRTLAVRASTSISSAIAFEERRQRARHRGAEDLPDERAGLGLASVRDRLERGALLRIRALVDHGHRRAFAQVDRLRPRQQDSPVETVERYVAEAALFDMDEGVGAAVAVRRECVELTRAAQRAVAVRELDSANPPFDISHGDPPAPSLVRRSPGRTPCRKAFA